MSDPIQAPEPVGGFSQTISNLRWTLANCQIWKDWITVATAQLALQKIHLFALPPPAGSNGYTVEELEALRPAIALTYIPPAGMRTSQPCYRRYRSAAASFAEEATIYAHVFETIDPAIAPDKGVVLLTFANRLGQLLDNLLELEESDTDEGTPLSHVQSASVVIEPHCATQVIEGVEGNYVQAMLRIDVGLKA